MSNSLVEEAAEVLIQAKEFLDEPDYIVDLYDMTFIWISPRGLKLTGYSAKDIGTLRNIDIIAFDKVLTESKFRMELIKRLHHPHGQMNLPIKTATGDKIHFTVEYQVMDYKGGWYVAGQILSSQPLD